MKQLTRSRCGSGRPLHSVELLSALEAVERAVFPVPKGGLTTPAPLHPCTHAPLHPCTPAPLHGNFTMSNNTVVRCGHIGWSLKTNSSSTYKTILETHRKMYHALPIFLPTLSTKGCLLPLPSESLVPITFLFKSCCSVL